MHDHHDQPDAQSGNVSEAAHLEKDPVCGMNVDPGSAKHSAEYGGRTYYFCGQGCTTKFAADPVSYIGEKPKPLTPVRKAPFIPARCIQKSVRPPPAIVRSVA
jgi:Cu+-exporting ATPase